MKRLMHVGKNLLCVVLAAAIIAAGISLKGQTEQAVGLERTFDIGVNPESVTATIDDNGLLTVSGSGAIRDFTGETAPFVGCGVTGVKLGADITAIGNYTFYNCELLRGEIVLPEGLVRIGDRAFFGESGDKAPKPDLVENGFTEALVTRKRDNAESSDSKYYVERLTQQEIGQEIFLPEAVSGAFSCSGGNESFRDAMAALGFREAEALLSATFDCGEGASDPDGAVTRNVAVVDGGVVLPDCLPGFRGPEGSELCAYSFGGWTEYRDEADVVRPAGSRFPVTNQEDLYFIASWQRTVLVAIETDFSDGVTRFSVPAVEGYTFTSFRWQYCGLEPNQEIPQDQELLSWQDIPGEEGRTYERQAEPKDGSRLFRCVVTAEKKQNIVMALFAAARPEELALGAVYGVEADVSTQVLTIRPGSYDGQAVDGAEAVTAPSSTGYVTIPENPYYAASSPSDKTVVFNGWQGEDGKLYDPGMVVLLPEGGLFLEAQWAEATVLYVSADGSADAAGTREQPCGHLDAALKKLPADGTVYSNIVVLLTDLADETDPFTGLVTTDRVPEVLLPAGQAGGSATITSWEPGTASGNIRTLTTDITEGGARLGGNVRFENISLKRGISSAPGNVLAPNSGDDIYAEGYRLTVGKGVTTDGKLALVGGNKTGDLTSGASEMIVQSGEFPDIFGGNGEGRVYIGGSALISGSVFGGGRQAGGSAAGAEVYLSGGTVAGSVYGGGQAGNVLGDCSVVMTGTASAANLYGGGKSGTEQPAGGNVTGNTSVVIDGNGVVSGNVFGGGQGDESLGGGNVTGKTAVQVAGSCSVGGNVYGGGHRGRVGGTSVRISGGTVNSVFGGGSQADVAGDADVSVKGSTGPVTILSSLFGSGETSSQVSGDAHVLLDGEGAGVSVSGSVLGSGGPDQVQGSAYVTIQNFQGTLAALRQADRVSVTGSDVTLAGEADPAAEGGQLFSITSLGNLQITSSTVTILSDVRELESLTSGDAGAVSTLRLRPGTELKIGPETGYGRVSGVFWLEMAEQAQEGETLRIEADTESDWGDGLTNTGAFLRKDSERNADPADSSRLLGMTSGTVAESHNYWVLGGTSPVPAALAAVQSNEAASQTVFVVPGRSFGELISSGDPVTVSPWGAVTAEFQTEIPAGTETASVSLNLCAVSGEGEAETAAAVNFPAGAWVVLADRSAAEGVRYYSYRSTGEEKLSLNQFTNMDGTGAAYSIPTGTDPVSKTLLFAVDFSGAAESALLPQGNYFLALTHSADEAPENAARAEFSVTGAGTCSLELAKDESTTDTVWALTLTPRVPEGDTRYGDGVSIRVSFSKENVEVGFPDVGEVRNVENVLRDQNGSVCFTLPENQPSTVLFDLSAVPESMFAAGEYTVSAVMGPGAGLQTGSGQGAPGIAGNTVEFQLARAAQQERSLSVALGGNASRLVDVSQGEATLEFQLGYKNLQDGDHLEADLFRKTGNTPGEESYTRLTDAGWVLSQLPEKFSGSEAKGTVTLSAPKTAEPGTYRVKFRIVGQDGSEEAAELYNFIVKKARE